MALKKRALHDSTSFGSFFIMGKNCLEEFIKVCPEKLKKVYVQDFKDKKPHLELFRSLETLAIAHVFYPKKELTDLVQSDSHQGFVAQVYDKKPENFSSFLRKWEQKDKGLLLLVDSIMDPQNLGAIFRAASCFSADAIIWSKNRGCHLTPTVAKASVGALAHVPYFQVSNLCDCILKLQKKDCWVYATACDSSASNLYEVDFSGKCAVVLGSEGKGVRSLVIERADASLYIPLPGQLNSLNVSQASALVLSHMSRKIYG